MKRDKKIWQKSFVKSAEASKDIIDQSIVKFKRVGSWFVIPVAFIGDYARGANIVTLLMFIPITYFFVFFLSGWIIKAIMTLPIMILRRLAVIVSVIENTTWNIIENVKKSKRLSR